MGTAGSSSFSQEALTTHFSTLLIVLDAVLQVTSVSDCQ